MFCMVAAGGTSSLVVVFAVENRQHIDPSSPIRYDTSDGSIQRVNSCGSDLYNSSNARPLTDAAFSRTVSITVCVMRMHLNAEPRKGV